MWVQAELEVLINIAVCIAFKAISLIGADSPAGNNLAPRIHTYPKIGAVPKARALVLDVRVLLYGQ